MRTGRIRERVGDRVGSLTEVLHRRWGRAGVWTLELGLAAILVGLIIALLGIVSSETSEKKPSAPLVSGAEMAHRPITAPEGSPEAPRAEENAAAKKRREQENPGRKKEDVPAPYRPTGVFVTVPESDAPSGPAPVRTFSVQVEKGLPIEPAVFAREVSAVLGSPRSWGGRGNFSVQRVDSAEASFRVLLASPQTTDALCAPLQTNGIFSCAEGTAAILNFDRWMNGATAYEGDLASYRIYMINHEVGHVFGHGHTVCPAAGTVAPVMMQQTKGVGACSPNPWPLASET